MPTGESPVYIYELPMSTITAAIGQGPSLPTTVVVATPGSTALSTYKVPAGKSVQITLLGGGGGGGSGDGVDHGGGGGGGAGGVIATIDAAIWALGGTLVVGAGGAGGLTGDHDGSDGVDSTLTIDSSAVLTSHGGKKGLAATHTGGAGGTVVVGDGATVIRSAPGTAGTAGTTTAAGSGGSPGVPGAGAGGAGGAVDAGAGAAGGSGRAVLVF